MACSRISNAAKQKFHLIDASGEIVGRLASRVCPIIRGKHKPTFAPNVDCGDTVVVINAKDIKFTGNKWKQKMYRWHTGYPGGLKERTAKEQFDKKPEDILRKAVYGMLPKNRMRPLQNKKLFIFPGPEHTFHKQLQS